MLMKRIVNLQTQQAHLKGFSDSKGTALILDPFWRSQTWSLWSGKILKWGNFWYHFIPFLNLVLQVVVLVKSSLHLLSNTHLHLETQNLKFSYFLLLFLQNAYSVFIHMVPWQDKGIGHWRFNCILSFPWRPILSGTFRAYQCIFY